MGGGIGLGACCLVLRVLGWAFDGVGSGVLGASLGRASGIVDCLTKARLVRIFVGLDCLVAGLEPGCWMVLVNLRV